MMRAPVVDFKQDRSEGIPWGSIARAAIGVAIITVALAVVVYLRHNAKGIVC